MLHHNLKRQDSHEIAFRLFAGYLAGVLFVFLLQKWDKVAIYHSEQIDSPLDAFMPIGFESKIVLLTYLLF